MRIKDLMDFDHFTECGYMTSTSSLCCSAANHRLFGRDFVK